MEKSVAVIDPPAFSILLKLRGTYFLHVGAEVRLVFVSQRHLVGSALQVGF